MSISLSELLVLGQGSDLASERGVSCTGELPPASDPHLVERAVAARTALGSRALILGHHYQRDEVIQFADITGDSFKLAQAAAAQSSAEFIFFCGVHFMAESADILTSSQQRVILPDLAAGAISGQVVGFVEHHQIPARGIQQTLDASRALQGVDACDQAVVLGEGIGLAVGDVAL